MGLVLLVSILAGCVTDDRDEATAFSGFVARYTEYDRAGAPIAEFELRLERTARILDRSGTHVEAFVLEIIRPSSRTLQQVHYLSQDFFIVRFDDVCLPVAHDGECRYRTADFMQSGGIPPLGVGLPIRHRDGVPWELRMGQETSLLRARAEVDDDTLTFAWDTPAPWQGLIPGPGTFVFTSGELAPRSVTAAGPEAHRFERTLYQETGPLGVAMRHRGLLPVAEGPRGGHLFVGADEEVLERGFTHEEALRALRDMDRTVDRALEEGGCLVQHRVYLYEQPASLLGPVFTVSTETFETTIRHTNGSSWSYSYAREQGGATSGGPTYRLLGSEPSASRLACEEVTGRPPGTLRLAGFLSVVEAMDLDGTPDGHSFYLSAPASETVSAGLRSWDRYFAALLPDFVQVPQSGSVGYSPFLVVAHTNSHTYQWIAASPEDIRDLDAHAAGFVLE